MSRYLRYLRITFSATCLIVCVLLIVLWVPSYFSFDGLVVSDSTHHTTLYSDKGSIAFTHLPRGFGPSSARKTSWRVTHSPRMFDLKDWDWQVSKTYQSIQIPFWFPVTLVAALALVPWIRQLKWRFSLRTLLIATTLVAVLLGLIYYASR